MTAIPRPALFTFDVFGTIVDWRRGLAGDLAALGLSLAEGDFDRVIDRQAVLEHEHPLRSYRYITAQSLVDVLGVSPGSALSIGERLGAWPAYPDSVAALRRLMAIAPCVAMTNSDPLHGTQVQAGLGFNLSDWLCAEAVGCYKPDPRFWQAVSARLGIAPGRNWWHVSAYADYDGGVASSLGLTSVFVNRPHGRPGPATHTVMDLAELAVLVGDGPPGAT